MALTIYITYSITHSFSFTEFPERVVSTHCLYMLTSYSPISLGLLSVVYGLVALDSHEGLLEMLQCGSQSRLNELESSF